ncbi:MAG TPA: cell division protein FtsK [Nocardioidaceae bacterium]|nr:cell division protein FtsK [Nocardioidaceae bacterium]
MPSPPSPSSPAALTRRAALAALAAGSTSLVAGCTFGDDRPRRGRRGRRRAAQEVDEDPDIAVAALALAHEQAVLDALVATDSRHPRLAGRLAAAIVAHRAHIALLADAVPDGKTPPEPGALSSPEPADEPFRVPAKPRAALTRLAVLEQELSVADKRHAFTAQSGSFARLLASMAASASQHAATLEADTTTAATG